MYNYRPTTLVFIIVRVQHLYTCSCLVLLFYFIAFHFMSMLKEYRFLCDTSEMVQHCDNCNFVTRPPVIGC